MNLNLSNFNIKKTRPILLGNIGLPEDTERYIVKAQGIIGIDIFSEDEVTILNIEGGQICEVTAFDNLGKNNNNIITSHSGLRNDANFIKSILINSDDKNIILKKLKQKNIDLNKANSINFFNNETKVKEFTSFQIQKEGFLIFAAPGGNMKVDKQDVATDLFRPQTVANLNSGSLKEKSTVNRFQERRRRASS